jgi:hypothetical protein
LTQLATPFSKREQPQTTNSNECELGEILDLFHGEFHAADQGMTEEEHAECFDIFQQLILNYVPRLTPTQWIKVLGELVVGMYVDDLTAVLA